MKYTPELIVKNNLMFSIPLYQRLFEWNPENVIQLMDDLNRAKGQGDYYVGMLTMTHPKNRVYQLVDGQQRFTVVTLMGCVLQEYYPDWHDFLESSGISRLSFISRNSDGRYLRSLICKQWDYEGDIANGKMKEAVLCIRKYMDDYPENERCSFAEYIYKYLCFFLSELPNDYDPLDLNKYFERMNSSGKNLEQHEVLKVKLLSKLGGNINFYMQLWNKIADVDTVLLRKKDNEEDWSFHSRKDRALNLSIDDIVSLKSDINGLKDEAEENFQVIDAIPLSTKKPQEQSTFTNGSRCVLRFPHFLLQVLYYFISKEDNIIKPRLDEFFNPSNLLDTFLKYLPYEGGNIDKVRIKNFLELLLHCRIALDVCMVRSLEVGYSLDMNLSEDNRALRNLMTFESFLYVSSSNLTNYRWFRWIMNYIEEEGRVPDAIKMLAHLKRVCDEDNKLPEYSNLNFQKEIRYWFWRLDYYIWENRELLFEGEENSQFLTIAENYMFVRNRSIEHIAPQSPRIESNLKWSDSEEDKSLMNSFGNLVMISQGLNSALSNSSFEEKKAHVESYFKSVHGTIESLKLLMVYKKYPLGWDREAIMAHGEDMYNLLKSEIPLEEP